ncbi:MAG: SDR family NAD(P)-dependent oxidoreductase [Bacteroides sp.]|nr:SDR family NAD(P)-dependent oxidoreductase [Bacteroides sp.]
MNKIIIMGASSGIGLKVAEEFASRNMKVGVAARHTGTLSALKEKYPDFVEYEEIDINTNEAPGKLKRLIDKLGGMDIYFHVSGIGYDNPELEPNIEAAYIDTNAGGFARMVSSAYGYYRVSGKPGRIVAVTSVAGTKGIGVMAAYSSSKKCAQTYLKALRQLANIEKVKVRITDIRPGWIRTPLIKEDAKYPLEMNLDEAVPQIIGAIVKAPKTAVIDWKWNVVSSVWKLIPDFIWTHIPFITE